MDGGDCEEVIRDTQEKGIPFAQLREYWNFYFPSFVPSVLDLTHPLHKIVYIFSRCAREPWFDGLLNVSESACHYYEVSVNYEQMASLSKGDYGSESLQLSEVMAEIFHDFQCDASSVIPALSLVLHGYMVKMRKERSKKVYLLIENYPESQITDFKANMIDNFMRFQAVVLKVYQPKLMPISLEFECPDCKGNFTHYLTDGVYSQPNKCIAGKKECHCKVFILKKEKVKTTFIQRIKVQEIDSMDRSPKQIVCEFRENNVGKVITGETIKISGVIKTEVSEFEKDKKTQGIYVPFLLANNITQKTRLQGKDYDMGLINEMKNNKNIFYSLVKSFCPLIYGHEIVKAGILLGIVGGSSKKVADQSTFRETSHILLLGDPGLGKSQLLKFAVQILPHSLYVSATNTTASGLTVTVNKDNNQQSLEAGALILADNGVCAIDEFDKTSDSNALLQAMEQQTISIAKAGVICQLKSRVGILASANPVNGCYNRAKSFKDNTKISNAILSRFDLIFLLVDKPDPERDRRLAEHIMKVHNNKRKMRIDTNGEVINTFDVRKYDSGVSLADKYNKICEVEEITYKLEDIKKYLTYIKKEVHPVLSREAGEVIKGFYIVLRENSPSNSFQITNRQLESMVRLAMARTRIEGRTVVTEQDAIEVTQLMQESLFDSFEEMGYNVDSLRYETKKAKISKKNKELSLPKQRTLFINTLRQQSESEDKNIWEWSELVKIAKELDLNIGDFHSFVERLNQDGVLLQKGNKKYQFKGTYI